MIDALLDKQWGKVVATLALRLDANSKTDADAKAGCPIGQDCVHHLERLPQRVRSVYKQCRR
jgi:hypothetical protein